MIIGIELDWLVLLLVFFLQLVVLFLFLLFLRRSNKRLIAELADLREQLGKLNQFVLKIARSQERIRHKANASETSSEQGENALVSRSNASDPAQSDFQVQTVSAEGNKHKRHR
jgi:ABC-type multidrug transport system fused ATPase/permease subunit